MLETFSYLVEDFSDGFKTRQDRSQLPPGAAFAGKNTTITDGDKIAPQQVKQLFGDADTGTTPITSSGVIITRESGSTFVYHAGTKLYYYNTFSETVETLQTGRTDGAFFGFVQSSENTDFTDFLYFGNGVDEDSRWNGAHATLDGALAGGETEVTVNESLLTETVHDDGTATAVTTTTLTVGGTPWGTDIWNDLYYVLITSGANAGDTARITDTTNNVITFDAITGLSGTPTFEIRQARFASSGSLILNETEFTYSSISGEFEFGGCSGVPAASDDAGLAQAVTVYPDNPRGNIHKMLDGYRLVGSTFNSTIYRSKVFEPDDFTFGSPRAAGEGDIIDVVDNSGNITGIGIYKGFFLALKRDLVKPYRYSQDENDILTADTQNMKVSLLCGADSPGGVVAVDNGLYSCVTTRGIRALAASSDILDGQTINLSYDILPTIEAYDLSEAATAFVFDRVFIACKTSTTVPGNDVVLVFNFKKGAWEPPIEGWNISSFFFWNGGFYGTSSLTQEIYRLYNGFVETRGDDELPVQASWSTAYQTMGLPAQRKKFNALFLEGSIAQDTELTIGLAFEHNGVEGMLETTIVGTDGAITLTGTDTDSLALESLAIDSLGASDADEPGMERFRVILTTQEKPFYECYLTFSSDGVNQQWEITRYGMNVIEDPTHDTSIKKALN